MTVDSLVGPVRVEATPAGDANNGGIAVVVTPVRPPAIPEIPAIWPLTPQEREVVALVLRGAGNHSIAATLSIGEHTVETHMRHAYEKLDVRGRGGLLSRFFRETFATTLDPPDIPSRGTPH